MHKFNQRPLGARHTLYTGFHPQHNWPCPVGERLLSDSPDCLSLNPRGNTVQTQGILSRSPSARKFPIPSRNFPEVKVPQPRAARAQDKPWPRTAGARDNTKAFKHWHLFSARPPVLGQNPEAGAPVRHGPAQHLLTLRYRK